MIFFSYELNVTEVHLKMHCLGQITSSYAFLNVSLQDLLDRIVINSNERARGKVDFFLVNAHRAEMSAEGVNALWRGGDKGKESRGVKKRLR